MREVVDPRVLPRLLKQVEPQVGRVLADGAYDARGCYRAIDKKGALAVIPPRKGATLWRDEYLKDRNRNLRGVRRLGTEGWKQKAKYHRRSLVETAAKTGKKRGGKKLKGKNDLRGRRLSPSMVEDKATEKLKKRLQDLCLIAKGGTSY